jgi:hypothetical protein
MKPLLLTPVLVLALAACGGGSEEPAPTPPASAVGPGISIADATASDLRGALLVNGNLLAEGDRMRFCSALAESFPPQCAGPQLEVEGLDLAQIKGLTTERDVSWTDKPIQLLGTVEDGVLTVSKTSL